MPTASLEALQVRSQMLWTIREFFHSHGLAEVQTPILSHDTVIDRHIDPISLPAANLSLSSTGEQPMYLQTSPEFCMKRLLAAGMTAIYEITPVFRAAERGQYHNPEFTMVEWYRVGDDLQDGVRLLSDLVKAMLHLDRIDAMTYQESFLNQVQCDPLHASTEELAELAVELQLGVALDWSDQRDDWLNLIFAEAIQPKLGHSIPAIITHYPASQSALAKVCAADPRVAERYELFANGIELANGYHELLDAEELSCRNATVLQQRERDGKLPLPSKSRLLAAMRAGLPPCSGCALGFDRLMMVAMQAGAIDEVIPFPIERA